MLRLKASPLLLDSYSRGLLGLANFGGNAVSQGLLFNGREFPEVFVHPVNRGYRHQCGFRWLTVQGDFRNGNHTEYFTIFIVSPYGNRPHGCFISRGRVRIFV